MFLPDHLVVGQISLLLIRGHLQDSARLIAPYQQTITQEALRYQKLALKLAIAAIHLPLSICSLGFLERVLELDFLMRQNQSKVTQ